MAITDNIYQDLIMNPEGVPNALQNLQRFSPLTNQADIFTNQRFDEIPGFNFIDAPIETPFIQKAFKPEFRSFLNNPAVLNPVEKIGSGITSITNKAKSGFGKGIDLGKAAIGGIASLATGIPGIGLLLNAFGPMTEEEKAMRDFYGSEFGLTDTGQVASGIMQGYNPVSMFGSAGLTGAIDKRMAAIRNTLENKKSVALENRLKELQRIKEAEQKAREARAREIQDRNRAERTGGYQSDFSQDKGFMEGRGTAAEMGSFRYGGLAGLL